MERVGVRCVDFLHDGDVGISSAYSLTFFVSLRCGSFIANRTAYNKVRVNITRLYSVPKVIILFEYVLGKE